ncbi:MAG TPA: helix-turn-helix domain-containing protein [Pyrinomonadaceae bacterium]
MNSTATWEREELESTAAPPDQNSESSPSNIATLKELVLRLLSELHCVAEINTLSIVDGLDFYDEVSRFEIDLIKRALFQTGGHQVKAAKLLNLKVTTLNSKIKHYNINPGGFSNIYPLVETLKIEDHRHA